MFLYVYKSECLNAMCFLVILSFSCYSKSGPKIYQIRMWKDGQELAAICTQPSGRHQGERSGAAGTGSGCRWHLFRFPPSLKGLTHGQCFVWGPFCWTHWDCVLHFAFELGPFFFLFHHTAPEMFLLTDTKFKEGLNTQNINTKQLKNSSLLSFLINLK